MDTKNLHKRAHLDRNNRTNKKYLQFQGLITELRDRELSEEIVNTINREIDIINSWSGSENKIGKQLKNSQSKTLKLIKKEINLVTKHYYRNIWLAVGNAVFGVPIGIAIGVITGNMAFIAIGLPMGFGFGLAVGTGLDQKAREKGKQLNFETNY